MIFRKSPGLLAACILLGNLLLCMLIVAPYPHSLLTRFTATALFANGLVELYFFLAFFLILRRMLSAALLVAFVCLLVAVGSNFKFSIVSQPVVASDFILFGQVLANPGLFAKYFIEQWYLFPLLAVILALPVWALRFERPLFQSTRHSVMLAIIGVMLLWQIQDILLKPSAPLQQVYQRLLPAFDHRDPMASVKQYGLFATLVNAARGSYFQQPEFTAADHALVTELEAIVPHEGAAEETTLPNIVVIQNEALFDFRVLDPAFPATAYAVWDQLKKNSMHGLVQVDTYGGATLRTEFSLLTGIPLSLFGAEMDYPYLTVVTKPIDSLAWHLKYLGYRTTAMHPFINTFWRRHLTYPRLGFDKFLSENDFAQAARDGPYISDQAVCHKIRQRLENNDQQPQFVFAVTMENHGPWSFDRAQSGDLEQFDLTVYPLPKNIELQLKRYLYHAGNAALMAECLMQSLAQSSRPGVLLFFGDHAPAMPEVFTAFSVDNPWYEPRLRLVPYLLWQSTGTESEQRNVTVSRLAGLLLQQAQVPQERFFLLSHYLNQYCLREDAAQGMLNEPSNCPADPLKTMRSLVNQRLQDGAVNKQ